jgi:hypothetical protein
LFPSSKMLGSSSSAMRPRIRAGTVEVEVYYI